MTRGLAIALALLALRCMVMPLYDLVDSTEARYALVGRDMARSGDYVTPKIWTSGEQVPYLGKPPLQFLLIAGSMKLLGETPFAARIPTWIIAFALLLVLHGGLRRLSGVDVADTAACILVSSPLFFICAGAVLLDVSLTLFVTAASICLWVGSSSENERTKWLGSLGLFSALGLGVMTKGPIALMLLGMPMVFWTMLSRDFKLWRWIRWPVGLTVFLAITLPWYVACEIKNPGFLRYFLINENLLRYFRKDYGDQYGSGHRFPYGTAIVFLLIGSLPWVLFSLYQAARGRAWRTIHIASQAPHVRFFGLGVLGYTIFLSAAKQLLTTYLLPVLPWAAVWLAVTLKDIGVSRGRIIRLSVALTVLYATAFVIAAPIMNKRKSTRMIIEAARVHLDENGGANALYFVRNNPYSSYFYGDGVVNPHPMERADDSFQNAKADNAGALFVIRDRDMKRISQENVSCLTLLKSWGSYGLYDWKAASTEAPQQR